MQGAQTFGELLLRLRTKAGRTQEKQAEVINAVSGRDTMSRREISRYENNENIPTNHTVAHIAITFGLSPEQLQKHASAARAQRRNGGGGAGRAQGDVKRRVAAQLAVLAFAAPSSTAQVLEQSAAEALEFTRQAEATKLGSGTLDHLEVAVAGFNSAYCVRPPQAIFEAVLDYRRKIDVMLRAQHTHQQGRELYAFAGWLSELLAWLAHDLGDARTGLAFATDAFVHAQQAGHGQLCAWAMDAAASINLYEQRPAHARAAALKGLAEAPATHPLTVRLHAQVARASAADGDADGFSVAFNAAREAHSLLPPRSPSRFGVDVLPFADYALTSYPATSYIWLGQAGNARRHAERALTAYATAPAASRAPSREAIARIDLALAHAMLGAPDDAVSLGHHALDSTRVVGSVRNRAAGLTTYLARRYPRAANVEGLRERLATESTENAAALPAVPLEG
ncbi:helix-turn-helix domain-containing protein [Streptomyces uncialis]|uniref:helix-turn-helix domain-containing protein n=1 Tax=Streptomyces uncialis TaxID=1048205 RepID=UPI0033F5E434